MIALDTHVTVWLYQDGAAAVPDGIAERIEREPVLLPPPVELELAYLHEIGRITVPGDRILAHLRSRLDVPPDDMTAADLFAAAVPLTWTRDPFDRLICAYADLHAVDLATKDQHLHAHHPGAVW